MSEIYDRGAKGEKALSDWLRERGRDVRPSPKKAFDLIVAGVNAEVKSSHQPYSALDFIGLTDNQFAAVEAGEDFIVFVVCNLCDPANLEVREIRSREFRAHPPRRESTYYWYRTALDKMG